MDQAGLNARLLGDADNMKWSKLLTNLIGSASSAILEMPPAEIYDHPILYWMEHQQLFEAISVMRAQNINVINLPGTPVKMLAFAIRFLPRIFSRPILKRAVAGGRGNKMPSLYLDLHRGRKVTEVEYLQGAVVRAGQEHGLPTPVNEFLTQTLLGLTSSDISWNIYQGQPEKLIEDLNGYINKPVRQRQS